MKRYKKVVALFLTAAMMFTMAGCKSKEKSADSDDVKDNTTASTEEATSTPEPTKDATTEVTKEPVVTGKDSKL